MNKYEEIYSITRDGITSYYLPLQVCSIFISIPNTLIQRVIDCCKRHGCAWRINGRIEPVKIRTIDRYASQAGATIRVSGCARHIFALLDEVGVHQHDGINYHANGRDWARPARKVDYTHRAYWVDSQGKLRSKLIEACNVPQFKANGRHVVEI